MKAYLGFDVPSEWEDNVQGYIALLTMETRRTGHQPTAYYIEED